MIESLPAADSDQREGIVSALEEVEHVLDALEQQTDAIQLQDTTIVTTAVTSRLQVSLASIGVVLGLSVLLPIVALYLLRRHIIHPIRDLSPAAYYKRESPTRCNNRGPALSHLNASPPSECYNRVEHILWR